MEPGQVNIETGAFSARDGASIFHRRWRADAARASIVIAHGLGEHSGRYDVLARFLAGQSLDVWALDHRGHGKSGGTRGVIAERGDYLADLDRFVKHVHATTGAAPFLLGHSLGGLIAAAYATRKLGELRGLVLSSPAIRIYAKGAAAALARTLDRVAPNITVPNGLKLEGLSHDPAVAAAYKADPLVHNKVSGRVVAWMLSEGEYAADHAHELTLPTLVMWSGRDLLVNPAGAELFAGRLPAAIRTTHRYPELFHEIFNEAEPARAGVWADLLGWFDRQLAP